MKLWKWRLISNDQWRELFSLKLVNGELRRQLIAAERNLSDGKESIAALERNEEAIHRAVDDPRVNVFSMLALRRQDCRSLERLSSVPFAPVRPGGLSAAVISAHFARRSG
jgi:hypothetical protein